MRQRILARAGGASDNHLTLPRRIHTPILHLGLIELAPAQAHHVHTVLRLNAGDAIEAFDDDGAVGQGLIHSTKAGKVTLQITELTPAADSGFSWSIAAAIPKGARADWMVEKLSELGTHRLIPLAAERSVSLPEGANRIARWSRLATEAARQSGRSGVMKIEALTPLAQAIKEIAADKIGLCLSTEKDATPLADLKLPQKLLFFVGPEGGWTSEELDLFRAASVRKVKLANTILRIETAAIAAAAWCAGVECRHPNRH